MSCAFSWAKELSHAPRAWTSPSPTRETPSILAPTLVEDCTLPSGTSCTRAHTCSECRLFSKSVSVRGDSVLQRRRQRQKAHRAATTRRRTAGTAERSLVGGQEAATARAIHTHTSTQLTPTRAALLTRSQLDFSGRDVLLLPVPLLTSESFSCFLPSSSCYHTPKQSKDERNEVCKRLRDECESPATIQHCAHVHRTPQQQPGERAHMVADGQGQRGTHGHDKMRAQYSRTQRGNVPS